MTITWRHCPPRHWDHIRERELRARRVCAMDGGVEIKDGDLVRFVSETHPLGRALHDAGPDEPIEIGGVDIVTLQAPESGDRGWCVYTVAGD